MIEVIEFAPGSAFILKQRELRVPLRVLLVKNPDISTPMFLGHYLFGCIIKSTHPGGLPKTKSWDLGACTVQWKGNQVLGPKMAFFGCFK